MREPFRRRPRPPQSDNDRQTRENVPRRPLRPRFYERSTDHPAADPRPAGIRRPAGLDYRLAGLRRLVAAPPNGNCGRSCWRQRAAGRSTWCWCGGWIGGVDRWRTCWRLSKLQHLGVGFVSLTEALDLTTPAGRAMAALLAVFAEFEREILRERVRAGLAHARQNGKKLGRPITSE